MAKLLFLASGGGGNLKFIKQCIEEGIIKNCDVEMIADRDCGAYIYAKNSGLPAKIVDYSRTNNAQLLDAIRQSEPDMIITNIHKVLDAQIVGICNKRLINLHYSLLPLFKGEIGSKPVQQALEHDCKFIGTTVHYVNEVVDDGEIISQSVIRVIKEMNFDSLMNFVFRSGCLNLLNALNLNTNIEVLNNKNTFSPENMIFSPELSFKIDVSGIWDKII